MIDINEGGLRKAVGKKYLEGRDKKNEEDCKKTGQNENSIFEAEYTTIAPVEKKIKNHAGGL